MRLVAIHVAMIHYHDTNLIVNGHVSMIMFQYHLVAKHASVSRRGRDTLIPLQWLLIHVSVCMAILRHLEIILLLLSRFYVFTLLIGDYSKLDRIK